MTGVEMNVFLPKKTILPAMTGLLLLTGGCVGSFDPQTDMTSPVAPPRRRRSTVRAPDRRRVAWLTESRNDGRADKDSLWLTVETVPPS